MTKITVNGRAIDADPKQPLIRACHDQSVDVPMYCYHPGLPAVGSCRICQVEATLPNQPTRVVVACRTPVVEGMVVNTEAAKAHEARRECLEFLLKNHPLDCPICDKAGECDLQDYSFNEGQGLGRSNEPRRKLDKRKSLGDVIVLDEERCILCSRCVRFFESVTKKPQLCVEGLGSRSVINTFADKPLSGNYQGNIADICPVGALTLKPFRFQARVWNLTKQSSTCAECSRGCAITIEVLRKQEVKRFRPRYDAHVNQWWMCDTGRFAYAPVTIASSERLIGAKVRGWGGLEDAVVDAALDVAADALRAHGAPVIVVSPFVTQEEALAVQSLALRLGTKPAFVSPAASGLQDDLLNTGDPCPNRRGLTELGFEALDAAAVASRLVGAKSALLAGERVAQLVGEAALAQLPSELRLVLLDVRVPGTGAQSALEIAALDIAIGVPTHVEKQGHWLNLDGVRREINVALAAPKGVESLESTLARLEQRVRAAEASAR